ncbi:uncharacterized protein LOC135134182 isoform X1 [Zophobas morio]
MDFLEEHSYVNHKKIKSECEKPELHLTEINIKMEYDDFLNSDEACDTPSVNPLEQTKINCNESEKDRRLRLTSQKADLKSRNTSDSEDDEGIRESALNLSGLKKACILQTCLNLLDSSSSDEDELMLLWLLCSKRKKKLRKKSK